MTDTQTGFVLTRSSVSRYGRTELEYWLATDFGPVLLTVSGQRPVFFIAQEHAASAEASLNKLGRGNYEVKPLELKTFQGLAVSAVYSATPSDAYHAQDLLKRAGRLLITQAQLA